LTHRISPIAVVGVKALLLDFDHAECLDNGLRWLDRGRTARVGACRCFAISFYCCRLSPDYWIGGHTAYSVCVSI